MTTHDLLSVMASWWPFIMLIGAWIVVARFSRQRTASGATMIELQEQHVEETRRTNVALEKIAAALDKRPQG
jgi:uncharacterized membrane protein